MTDLNAHEQDRRTVEQCLPSFMMFHVAESMKVNLGFELRPDVILALNVGGAAPLAKLDQMTKLRLAKRVEMDGITILKASDGDDDLRGLLIACSMFITKLVDEGLFPDPQNSSVLTGLMLLEEAKEAPELWGDNLLSSTMMGKMLNNAHLLGYFLPKPTVIADPKSLH